MSRLAGLVILAGALVAGPAQGEGKPRAIAIVNAKIHPVGRATIPSGTLVVVGEKIAALGSDVAIPAGAEIVDAKGRWVTPGLVDPLTTLGLNEIEMVGEAEDFRTESKDPIRAALDVRDGIDERSTAIAVARRHGVTAAGVFPSGGLVAGRGAWLELDGERGPNRPGLVGMLASFGEAGLYGSRAMAALKLRELFDDARTFRRDLAAFRKNQLRPLAASRLDLDAIADVAERRLPLFVLASRASDLRAVVGLAKAEKIDVAIVGGEEGWLVAEELAKANVPVVLSPMANLPARFETRYARADNAARLARVGVKIALSVGEAHNVGNLRFAAGNAVRAGLPWDVALAAVTAAPAEVLRQGKLVGTLEPGKLANLVVWTGDPFEPAQFAERVMIRGRWQRTGSRQTELFERYRARLGI